MDGRRGHYAKSHKERPITIFYHLYIDSNTENKWINKANEKRFIDIEEIQVVDRAGRVWIRAK